MLSAIICDRVIFDKITGMPSLINIIQTVNAPAYPIRNVLVFFCELTNGHGDVEFTDVQQIVTLAVGLHGVVFPEPGEYRFQLFTEGELLGERRVICRKIPMPGKPEGAGPQS
jgi:hypothetical protein